MLFLTNWNIQTLYTWYTWALTKTTRSVSKLRIVFLFFISRRKYGYYLVVKTFILSKYKRIFIVYSLYGFKFPNILRKRKMFLFLFSKYMFKWRFCISYAFINLHLLIVKHEHSNILLRQNRCFLCLKIFLQFALNRKSATLLCHIYH